MEKLNDVILVIIGILYGLPLVGVDQLAPYDMWLIAIGFIVMGVKGLMTK